MVFDLQIPIYSPLFTGTRNSQQLRSKWVRATAAAGLSEEYGRRKILTPRLYNVEISDPSGHQISALVDMSPVGRTSRELQQKIETVAATLGAYQIRVEKIDPAHSKITVYFQRPTALPHYRNTATTTTDGIDLEDFPILLDPTDDAPQVNLTTSMLIGGATESGKSNLVWYILSQLNKYGIPYRLWVIDPSGGVELNDLENSPLTRQYVDRVKDISQIVTKFRESMDKRLAQMKAKGERRHFPTALQPVEILIIDELLLCKSQLQGGDAASPLGEVLAVGRKALHIVIACSQLGEKTVIGQIRDLFQQRLCLRTRSDDITDTVLGSNATVDGAACHRITNRGEGYVFTDQSGVFEKFHAPHIQNTQAVARGGFLAPPPPSPKTRKFW